MLFFEQRESRQRVIYETNNNTLIYKVFVIFIEHTNTSKYCYKAHSAGKNDPFRPDNYNLLYNRRKALSFFYLFVYSPKKGEWADPGGTAIPGQPVGKSEQAPVSSPKFKNQFNIVDPRWGSYQILS